jgi:hypothetical protein
VTENEIRKSITERLLKSAQDADGFLSDGYVSDPSETWIVFDGTIDVQHLVSEVLIAIEDALADARQEGIYDGYDSGYMAGQDSMGDW